MADGLVLYDPDDHIRFCNQQYRDLFPKTADLRVAGARFSEIVRAAVQRGEEQPQGDPEAWVARRVGLLRETGDHLIELTDGRFIQARSRPVAQGDTLVVFTDVTSRKLLEADLRRRATHDPLTGLANRAEFEFRFAAEQQRARNEHTEIAVIMMDLDRFKQVNDRLGHAVGDKLLVEVASRLRAAVRATDLVARLGGDEFAFLVTGPNAELGAKALAERVLQNLRHSFAAEGVELSPGGSLGIACYPRDTNDPADLLVQADRALYAVKHAGGGGWGPVTGSSVPAVRATDERPTAKSAA